MSIDAMKQMVAALEEIKSDTFHPAKVFKHNPAIAAGRAAITEAERQEPVRCCEHDSDCAVHNEPAYPAGPCNCTLSKPEQHFRYKFLDRAALDAWIAANAIPLPTPQPASAWQPIEAAPRDGTEILAYTKYESFYVVAYDDTFRAPWVIRNEDGLMDRTITHWMPLPEPPKES